MTFQRAGLRTCRTAAKAEDEGVLLSVALDLEKGISFLLVLGTATLKEKA
jgi:carotenoid cleavage dioxygenase-like enzyme